MPFLQCAQNTISVDSPSWAEQNSIKDFVVACTVVEILTIEAVAFVCPSVRRVRIAKTRGGNEASLSEDKCKYFREYVLQELENISNTSESV